MIELAVVVFVIALLLGSILVPLHTQVEQRQIAEAQRTLEQIQEALIGHALTHGHFPCPDRTSGTGMNDGLEDVDAATGRCAVLVNSNNYSEGNLPWATLGLGALDPWGNRFRYKVTAAYAQRPPAATFNLATSAGLRVCSDVGGSCTQFLNPASPNGAVAIVLSHGRNGYGAMNAQGTFNPPPGSLDELENTDGGVNFRSRLITPAGSAAGEFDDVVLWIGKYTLFNRMVAAGKLP